MDILHTISIGDVVTYKKEQYVVLFIDYLAGGNCKEVCLIKVKRPFFRFIKPIYLYDDEIRQLILHTGDVKTIS